MTELDPLNVERLLIRSTNWVGDAILTTPTIRAIRTHFPHAAISILAKPWVAPIFENSPHVDHVLLYDPAKRHTGVWGKWQLAKDLRQHRFDTAILLQNAFEAALIAFLARIPRRIGYNTDGRAFLLTHSVPCTPEIKNLHQTQYYLRLLEGVGLPNDGGGLSLTLSEQDTTRALEILRREQVSPEACLVGINPGATFGTAKRWFPDRYADLCIRLKNSFDIQIVIFGGPAEAALGEQIRSLVGKGCVNLCGKTRLREAIAIIDRCRFFITNDSGLMHVAAALDVPQIAIFGPTNHVTTSPISPRSHMVRVPTACSPCLKPECPIDHHCMKDITVDMVYHMAESLLHEAVRTVHRGNRFLLTT